MSDIFISYVHEDRPTAELLAKALEAQGWSVWWDRSLLAGQTFRRVIKEEINKARCMVVIWSRGSVESEWVLQEASLGRKRHILVPVRIEIEDADLPLGFGEVQTADLGSWNGAAAAPALLELCQGITGLTGPPVIPAKAANVPVRAEIRSFRKALTNRWAFSAAGISVLVGALVIGLAIGLRLHLSRGPHSPVRARRSVAVLGFKNLSGRTELKVVGDELSVFLTTELGAGEHLRMVSDEDVAQMSIGLPDVASYGAETLRKLRNKADDIVRGTYLLQGTNQIRLDLRLQDTHSGETLALIPETGTASEVLYLAARAGKALRERLGAGPVSSDDQVEVEASLPPNAEAARFYSEGLANLRSFNALLARDLLEKAVAADPDYPLAHSALASAYNGLGYEGRAKEEAKRAVACSAGLPREKLLSIKGQLHRISHEWRPAEEIYGTLWEMFPDNLDWGYFLASVQNSAGKPREALSTVDQMRRLPAPLRDDPRIDLVEVEAAYLQGDFKRMQSVAARAAEEGEKHLAPLVAARARVRECWAYFELGQPDRASTSCEEGRSAFERAGDKANWAWALQSVGIIQWKQGNYATARTTFEKSLALYEEVGKRDGSAFALTNLAGLGLEQGRFMQTVDACQRVLEIYRETDDRTNGPIAKTTLAIARSNLGDMEGAKRLFGEVLEFYRDIGNNNKEAATLSYLASTQYALGDLAAAARSLDNADASMGGGDENDRALVVKGEGDISMAHADLALARRKYEEALALNKKLGQRGDQAVTQVSLARVSMEEGHAVDAFSMLREAIEGLRSQGQTDDLIDAQILLVEDLLEQDKLSEASKQVEETGRLAARSESPGRKIQFNIVSANLTARLGRPAQAEEKLESALEDATKRHLVNAQFEIRLALGNIEINSGRIAAGRARLDVLAGDANAKGFRLIGGKAAHGRDSKS
jgi:tetratricopeptide (TPR) repeat protein